MSDPWLWALELTAMHDQPTMFPAQWDKWDRCYGDEWVGRIIGMADHLLEVAFVAAIDDAGDLP